MATFVSPVTVSPMRNVLTLRSQNLNTVLTHVKGSVTIVVEDELESHEVLAGARRIGRALQPRSDRCLHSATAGGTVPLHNTMLSRRPSRPALDNQAAEARQAPTVEKPSKLGRQPQRLAEAPLEEQPVLDAARSSAAPEPGFGRTEGRTATLPGEYQPPTVEYQRSEEHTSELQALMRIAYDVFCLTKRPES